MSSTDAFPQPGEDIARYLVPKLLKRNAFPEMKDSFPLWWNSLKPNIPQSVRALRFEKAVDSFRKVHKAVEAADDDWRKCEVRCALAEIMWKDLSSFVNNPERMISMSLTRSTNSSSKYVRTASFSSPSFPSHPSGEGCVARMGALHRLTPTHQQFYLDLCSIRNTAELSLAARERCTQAYIDVLAGFQPKRPSMTTLRRLLRIEAYASLIQIASERAIQCWDLKQYKYARQALLTHESAIALATDLERDYEEAIIERKDRRGAKWMDGLDKLVRAADRESGYEYVFGRIAEAAADCQAYIKKCNARAEIDLGLKMFNEALLDDPAKIIEGVEDAQTRFPVREVSNAAITAAGYDWDLEGEALVRLGASLQKVFRRETDAHTLFRRAKQLAKAHNGQRTTAWYTEAERLLMGEEYAQDLENEARWAGTRAAVEGKLAEHLKPIEDFDGDLKAFIEWVWEKYPPLSTGGSKLPDGLFPEAGDLAAAAKKPKRGRPSKKQDITKVSNSAFKRIILRYHPDKGQERFGEVWKQTAETIVKQLNSRKDKHDELGGMA